MDEWVQTVLSLQTLLFLNSNHEGLSRDRHIGLSHLRSHYFLNTLRIMKVGQGGAEMENCAVGVH